MKTDTTGILDIAYKEVESKLSNNTNVNKYKQFVAKYIQAHQKELYSYMPAYQIYYSNLDVNDFFKATGIDEKIIKNGIKETYYSAIPNFNPSYAKDESTVALLCVLRYFILNKKEAEKNIALLNIAFSGKYYPSIFYGSFKKFYPQEHIMEYVVTQMLSNKYELVKEKSVIGAVRNIATTWMTTYEGRFKSFTDEDCQYLIQQLHNRIGSFIHNIAELYYKAYEDKDYLTWDSDDVSEDNYHIADSDSLKIERAVSNAMNDLTNKGIDFISCKRASNDAVKFDEIKSIFENIFANKDNLSLVKEYVTIMVSLFFRDSKIKDVRDLSFVSYSIKITPNSKDKYVLRKKEIIDILLINNAEHFARRRSRAATESAYYRAFNAYMALVVQKANK